MAKKADKALAARRVEDLLRIRLDGAEFWDVREYVREKEGESRSAWFLKEGENPLSDGQIRRYQGKADALILQSHERSRKRLLRRHLAQRRNLYAKAVLQGDVRTALAVLQDKAKMEGLYPAEKHEHTGKGGTPIVLNILEEVVPSDRHGTHVAADGSPPPGPASLPPL
jgi:hypothetical protein